MEFWKKIETDLRTPTMARLWQTLVIYGSFPLISELNVEGNWYFHNLAAFPPANSSVFAAASLEVTISSYLFFQVGTYLPACLPGTSRELKDSVVVWLLRFCDTNFAICDFCYAEFNKPSTDKLNDIRSILNHLTESRQMQLKDLS